MLCFQCLKNVLNQIHSPLKNNFTAAIFSVGGFVCVGAGG